MKKSAFTLAELVICIIIMFVIMGCAISIPFKKSKLTQQTFKKTGVEICSCSDNPTGECDIEILNPGSRNEFFTVQILGGGAASSPEKGGSAGEVKIIHYPSLQGRFKVRLGQGGIYGSAINGGTTVIYKVNEDGSLTPFEFARGGQGSNERFIPSSDDLPSDVYENEKAQAMLGEVPSFGAGETTTCGKGGNAPKEGEAISVAQNGTAGEVIIKW